MRVLYQTLHHIDYENNVKTKKDIPTEFSNFVNHLLKHMQANESVRLYKPLRQTTEVVALVNNCLKSIIENGNDENTNNLVRQNFDNIAAKLLEVEKNRNEGINLPVNIKKGSLIQAIITDAGEFFYAAAKVESKDFFDDDLYSRTGFPKDEEKIWKSCLFDFSIAEHSIEVNTAKVFLDGSAKYWWDSFLNLEPTTDDESNTKAAVEGIQKILHRNLRKKEAYEDYNLLRYTFFTYFRKERLIDFDDMVFTILNDYVPRNITENELIKLKNDLLKLPDTKKFDRQFEAIPKVMNIKLRQNYELNTGIELKVDLSKNNDDEVRSNISAEEDENGNLFVKVRTNNRDAFFAFRK